MKACIFYGFMYMIQQMWKEAWTLNQIATIPVKVKRFQETKYMSKSLSLNNPNLNQILTT